MLIYGFHPVREALRLRPQAVERVLLSDRAQRARVMEIEKLCRRRSVPAESHPAGKLDELTSGAVHNGFVAEVRARTAPGHGADAELVVLLEDVQDPRNLGAILRVCEGAGVGRVLIRDRGSAPLSAAAIKTSAGAAEYLRIDRVTNSANEIQALQKDGFWVYGADGAGEPVWNVDLTGKVCLCLGGEEKGLRPRTRKLCDRLVALPMRGRVESLNVATASAALLYEAVRQRQGNGD
ncbi:MAG: 23S rRNA (guanosine(2251)-2'-O)-methyltransferase RlmB [Acidobacteria bacterium]|nr:23S rRNA (guanosine(2251)-2'-O)-methyltransferase RlmB [Acidobacteriota bacterium]